MSKIGVLLINLGTPDSPKPSSVYTYLKQFLNDPRVIDIPALVRYFLVNWIIVPLRYKKSAHAYEKVWTENGSPLLVNSLALVDVIAKSLGDGFHVELGMRYGNPSIESAVQRLSHCEKLIAVPLFPQYSSAATGSAVEELMRVVGKQWNIPAITITKDFFNHPAFIQAYANIIKHHMKNQPCDLIIFSYHGLPERHLKKSACNAPCSLRTACPQIDDSNAYCYRAQCYETSRLLAAELNLNASQYLVTFQSRLGRTPWIQPYTDIELPKLVERGIKDIAIVCPSFVADCLETLEEINIRAREQWKQAGGNQFTFIPCLNDDALWAQGLVKIIKEHHTLIRE